MDLFSYNSGNGHLRERAMQGAAKHIPESGFIDNWGEALRMEFDEASSISKILNSELFVERADSIMKLYDSGAIPDDVMERFYSGDKFDYQGLAKWANDNVEATLMYDDEIKNRIREDLKVKRGVSEEVFNRANWWGKFGQFAGTMHAVVLDPILLPTYFIGVGAGAKGVTWLSRFGRGAAVTALTEGGFEAIRQPLIYSWKKEIGVDYNFKDAFSQIAAAGLGAGVLGGTAAAVSGGLKKFVRKNRIPGSKDSNLAVQNIENLTRELDRAPNSKIDAAEHIESIETEVKRQQTRNSADADEPIFDPEIKDAAADAERAAPLTKEDADADIVLESDEGVVRTQKYGEIIEEADDAAKQQELALGCLGNA